jgi:hypothetical protein
MLDHEHPDRMETVMRKYLLSIIAAATIAAATVTNPGRAEARCYGTCSEEPRVTVAQPPNASPQASNATTQRILVSPSPRQASPELNTTPYRSATMVVVVKARPKSTSGRRRRRLDQSSFSPISLINGPQRPRSYWMYCWTFSGVDSASGRKPASRSFRWKPCSAMAARDA